MSSSEASAGLAAGAGTKQERPLGQNARKADRKPTASRRACMVQEMSPRFLAETPRQHQPLSADPASTISVLDLPPGDLIQDRGP